MAYSVAVRREHLAAHVVLDERERAAARRVVGVQHLLESGVRWSGACALVWWVVAAVLELGAVQQQVAAADRPAAEWRLEPQVSAELVLADVVEERVLLSRSLSHGSEHGDSRQ